MAVLLTLRSPWLAKASCLIEKRCIRNSRFVGYILGHPYQPTIQQFISYQKKHKPARFYGTAVGESFQAGDELLSIQTDQNYTYGSDEETLGSTRNESGIHVYSRRHHVEDTSAPSYMPITEPFLLDDDVLNRQVTFFEVSVEGGTSRIRERTLSKFDLAAETGMPVRDLRPFTHAVNRRFQIASIVTRPKSFMINMEPLQAIVLRDKVKLFNVESDEEKYMNAFLQKLQRPSSAPFEHRALEYLLSTSVKRLEQEASELEPKLEVILDNVSQDPSSQHLWDLREVSDNIESHGTYVRQSLKAIGEMLGKEDEMLLMYLSARTTDHDHPSSHRDVELIFEAAEDRLQALDHSFTTMQNRITNTEQFLAISSATQRNNIIRITLVTSFFAVALAGCSLISGIFGMNLSSGYETDPRMFYYTIGVLAAVFGGVVFSGYRVLSKIACDRPARYLQPRWSSLLRRSQLKLNKNYGRDHVKVAKNEVYKHKSKVTK